MKGLLVIVGLAFASAVLGCSRSREIIIILPGSFNGEPLVLAETSYSRVFINEGDVVPSKINRIWWSEEVIVTENYPLVSRNKFSGDQMKKVDMTSTVYFLINLEDGSVERFPNIEKCLDAVREIEKAPLEIDFMSLREAQKRREEKLGFEFTPSSVNAYLKKLN